MSDIAELKLAFDALKEEVVILYVVAIVIMVYILILTFKHHYELKGLRFHVRDLEKALYWKKDKHTRKQMAEMEKEAKEDEERWRLEDEGRLEPPTGDNWGGE
tara:strand:+ start:402 stop:710 length:309 start_codon:yes stop_codon:yes gene_type:complete